MAEKSPRMALTERRPGAADLKTNLIRVSRLMLVIASQ